MVDPDYTVSTPVDSGVGDQKKTRWFNLGVGFKTKSGEGINLYLGGLPVNGKLLVKKFVPRPKKVAEAGALL